MKNQSFAFSSFIERLGIENKKISFIPNGVDLFKFSPFHKDETIRKKLGLIRKFVCIYVGSHGFANNLDYIIDAAKILKEDKSIVFLFIGDGNYKKKLVSRASKENVKNVIFHDPVDKKILATYITASDIGLAILLSARLLKTTYPNKVFDYMACSLPTIIAIDGVIRELIEKSRSGIYVDPRNPKELAKAIFKLKSHPEIAREMGQKSRSFLQIKFDRKRCTHLFADEIIKQAELKNL